MKKMKLSKQLALILVLICIVNLFAGCGQGGTDGGADSDSTIVEFMYGSSQSVNDEYAKLIEEFNNTVGKEKAIYVKPLERTYDGLQSALSTQLISDRGPDVVTLEDEWFKTMTKYLESLDGLVSDEVVGKLYSGVADRLVYNSETGSVDDNSNRYGFPLYNNTTVLYVNTGKLSEAGIICISVAEADLEAFNAGTLTDANGKTKADYGITAEVLAKGFQREKPYADGVNAWSKPSSGEVMIFNDKIAMNWDETEDLGRIMSKNTNPASVTDYGFYTEWWFNYGWSVGGDCLLDINNNYDYKFGIIEDINNYIVLGGKTYVGQYTGKTYTDGETLEFVDKLAIGKTDTVVATEDGKFTVNGSPVSVSQNVLDNVNAGVLGELPSTKKAFTRFAKLAAKEYDSTRISPYPSEISSAINYFTSEKIAMVIERTANLTYVKENMQDGNWTIALVPTYKEYVNPTSGTDDTVKVAGKEACHSHLNSVAIRKGSDVKEEAGVFIEWLMTEGQKMMARDGFGTLNSDYEQEALNANVFVNNTYAHMVSNSVSSMGDWMYLKDRSWINVWAIPLNSDVRNGNMTLDSWFKSFVQGTNDYIEQHY